MTNTNLAYFRRRLGEERNAARKSLNGTVRGIHLELADAYEIHLFLCEQLAALKAGEPLNHSGEGAAVIATAGASPTPHEKALAN